MLPFLSLSLEHHPRIHSLVTLIARCIDTMRVHEPYRSTAGREEKNWEEQAVVVMVVVMGVVLAVDRGGWRSFPKIISTAHVVF